MTVRAVLFDLDNTLTHRDLSVQAYSRYLAEQYSQMLNLADIAKLPRSYAVLIMVAIRKRTADPFHNWWISRFALLQELSWQSQPALEELSDFWFQYFGQFAVAMPQAENLLRSLKASDYKLAIISNGGHDTRMNIINGLGFAHYFDEIMSSGLVGISKPNPEIFQYTAQNLLWLQSIVFILRPSCQ